MRIWDTFKSLNKFDTQELLIPNALTGLKTPKGHKSSEESKLETGSFDWIDDLPNREIHNKTKQLANMRNISDNPGHREDAKRLAPYLKSGKDGIDTLKSHVKEIASSPSANRFGAVVDANSYWTQSTEDFMRLLANHCVKSLPGPDKRMMS